MINADIPDETDVAITNGIKKNKPNRAVPSDETMIDEKTKPVKEQMRIIEATMMEITGMIFFIAFIVYHENAKKSTRKRNHGGGFI